MNLARASVRRPVFTSMVTLIVIVLGLMAFSRLLIDLLVAGYRCVRQQALAKHAFTGKDEATTMTAQRVDEVDGHCSPGIDHAQGAR